MGDRALPFGVSILVVLDWGMRPASCGRRRSRTSRFNPCCLGLGNEAIIGRDLGSGCSLFQSLLSWIGE